APRSPLPVTRYPLPVTRYPLPVTRYPLPVTRYPLPVTRYPLPVTRPLPPFRPPPYIRGVRRPHSAVAKPLPPATPDTSARALVALREVAHAVLTAERVEEALQFTLERVSPVVNATFASVFLVEGDSDVMKLAAAFNWPERVRPWLSEMRVRLGFGPSGEAASERRVIEVSDVFSD